MAELNVHLSPDARQIIEDALESGEFSSPDAVMEEALRRWREQKAEALIASMGGADVMRRLIRQADEGGPSKPFDIEAIKTEARRRAIARAS